MSTAGENPTRGGREGAVFSVRGSHAFYGLKSRQVVSFYFCFRASRGANSPHDRRFIGIKHTFVACEWLAFPLTYG